jgi:PPOX class probable F420-dependent enzyme
MHHRGVAAVSILTPLEREFLSVARRAILATVDGDGLPRLVPICFVLGDPMAALRLYTPLDDKPKRSADPHELERVRDIVARPDVSILVDRWSEDWSRLGWLRLYGRAELLEASAASVRAEHAAAVAALREKYPQYATHRLEARPIIAITVERRRSWGDLTADP